MKTSAKILLWVLVLSRGIAFSQTGFSLVKGKEQVDIPFEYVNNFIILNVTINNTFPLKFIFDTGAEHTVLSKREISDVLKVKYEREFHITGSDLKTQLIAYLVRNIRFDIPEKVTAPSEDILVLQEDYFRFEEYAGINVHGILAGSAFSNYIIEINYQRQIISLYDRNYFKRKMRDFEQLPVEIFRNKIYLSTTLDVLRDSVAQVKLLLDTGAGLPMLLFSNINPLVHPPSSAIPTNIGMGLGGYLEGFVGRVNSLTLGSMQQRNVVTYFQQMDTSLNTDHLNHRSGLVGNALLSRFHLVLDYRGEKIWMKPARNFEEGFVYDRSGISLIASGASLNNFTVQYVLQHSPAAEADIRPGDRIKRIGIVPLSVLALGDVQRKFQKKPGTKLNLILRRDGKTLRKCIVLRDLI